MHRTRGRCVVVERSAWQFTRLTPRFRAVVAAIALVDLAACAASNGGGNNSGSGGAAPLVTGSGGAAAIATGSGGHAAPAASGGAPAMKPPTMPPGTGGSSGVAGMTGSGGIMALQDAGMMTASAGDCGPAAFACRGDDPTMATALGTAKGPYSVENITDGYLDGDGFADGTLYY